MVTRAPFIEKIRSGGDSKSTSIPNFTVAALQDKACTCPMSNDVFMPASFACFDAILLYSTLFYAILRYSTQFYAILRYATLFCVILRYSALFYAILRYVTLFCAILRYFVAILRYSTLFYVILRYSCFYAILRYSTDRHTRTLFYAI